MGSGMVESTADAWHAGLSGWRACRGYLKCLGNAVAPSVTSCLQLEQLKGVPLLKNKAVNGCHLE